MVGGLVRWLVDRGRRLSQTHLTEDQHAAESDRSPGVLLASGYIAGGAIAGIVIAFMAGVLSETDDKLTKWAEANNPFYAGSNADWLALIPFAALTLLLFWVSRGSKTATAK
jgi:xanthine/uracil permease